jgi:CBS domain containing-hemolysin-like protein
VSLVVGNNLVNVAASSIGTEIVGKVVDQAVVGISVVLMTILILIFGEIVPKTIAVTHPLRISLANAALVSASVRVFGPLMGLMEKLVASLVKSASQGAPPGETGEHVTEAIAAGHSEGVLDGFEREVLGGMFRLMHLSVQNIMTPRPEVFMLNSGLSVGQVLGLVKSSGYSRIPVFDSENRDNIVGILYAKDLLQRQAASDARVTDVARRPFFVPETKPLVDLLSEFVKGAAHFAVVIDEYGSFTGVITLDDILGEIIGTDSGQPQKRHCRRISRTSWEVPGRLEIEYFAAMTGFAVPETHAETVAGMVIEALGRIPAVGEDVVVGNLGVTVLEGDQRRIRRVRVRRLKR